MITQAVNQRAALAPFLERVVQAAGYFEKVNWINRGSGRICTALVQDVKVTIDGYNIDLGHVWVQHADEIDALGARHGEKIICDARIGRYKKLNDVTKVPETDYNLSYPRNVKFAAKAFLPVPAPPAVSKPLVQVVKPQVVVAEARTAAPAVDMFATLSELKRIREAVGGWDKLHELVVLLKD